MFVNVCTRGKMRRRAGDERGQAAFEFLIVLPFIFLMVEGVMIFEQWTLLDHATREGVRYAAVGHSTTAVQDCTAHSSNNILDSSDVSVAYYHAGTATGSPQAGDTVTVGV